MNTKQSTFTLRRITENKLFFPFVALALILLFDLIFVPKFFRIEVKEGNLYGSLIDIVRNASTIALLAIGMTLVIATGGVDLSVGAIMAIAASVAALMMNPYVLATELPPHIMKFMNDPHFTAQPLWLVIVVTLFVATICGLWNGILVAYGKIQPMVATLILMIAGRGIAQLITNGVRIQIFYEPYAFIGQGWIVLPLWLYVVALFVLGIFQTRIFQIWRSGNRIPLRLWVPLLVGALALTATLLLARDVAFGLPFSVYLVAIAFAAAWLLTRKTAIGLFIESVGINSRSSFFSGIEEKRIKLLAYMFCGLCAGIAGLVASSNIKTSDAFNLGQTRELDAILAVVIGGTLMSGGRFSLLASIVGAWVIQAITTSMYAIGVRSYALQAIKGVVVIFVILLYSEQVRSLVRRITVQRGA